jgi:nucleoside-triphosphatase THEP1
MNKIDEFANHFHNLNLKYAENIRGFDPNGIFVEHMLTVGFSSSFIHTVLGEEEDNNLGNPTHTTGDLEMVLSTNELYKQRGKGPSEKSAQSPTVTPKTSTPRSSAPVAHPSKKVINSSSGGGGDKNPPPGKIESSHKLPLRKKRKNIVQEEEEHRVESDINSFSLEDMELEADIEKMFPNIDQPGGAAHQNQSLEIVENEIFDEEESFVFQSVVFDNESKKLIIEKSDAKNKKGKYRSEVNLKNMRPSQVSRIHRATGDALDDSIGSLEAENTKLKERIKELEETLMPLPFLSIPLEIVGPAMPTAKIKGSSSLLTSARSYVENNIKKRMALITESWEISKSIVSFGSRAHAFLEYLQADLKNEEGFYLDVMVPFGIKVTNMSELKRREEDLPSPSRIKQLNACWKEKIKNLNNIVQACNQAITRREELFKRLMEVDLAGSTNEVQDPKLILNSLFLTKQQFDEQVEIFKGLSIEKFYGIIVYDENAIDNWLVDYSVKNQDIEEVLHGISIDL